MDLEMFFLSIYDKLELLKINVLTEVELKAPPGSVVIIQHKFIVLKSDEKIVIAFGPIFTGDNYIHSNLMMAWKSLLPQSKCKVSGGGFFELQANFHHTDVGEKRWSARFYGKSEGFGKFDPIIFSSKQSIVHYMRENAQIGHIKFEDG